MKGPDAAALRDLAPTGTMRVAVNVANAALISKGGDESLAGRIPDLARRLALWLGVPVEMMVVQCSGEADRDAAIHSAGADTPVGAVPSPTLRSARRMSTGAGSAVGTPYARTRRVSL